MNNYVSFDENIIPPVKEGAKDFLQELYESEKYELILFTTRNLLMVSRWLTENKIDKYFKNITNIKIPAYMYIDDRAIQFNGDFAKLSGDIKEFQVYWK